MLPAYLAFVILVVFGRTTGNWQRRFRFAAVGMILTSSLLGFLHPIYSLPKPRGPDRVGTVVLDIPAANLKKADGAPPGGPLRIQIWYPASPTEKSAAASYALGAEETGIRAYLGRRRLVKTAAVLDAALIPGHGRLPVLLAISGWGGARWDNTVQAQELASHGYVIAAMGDRYPEPPIDLSSAKAFEKTVAWADAKAKRAANDAIAVCDFISGLDKSDTGSRFGDRLDLSQVGIFGFSFGGAVALETAFLDRRFKAVVNLDGWFFGDAPKDWVDRPVLIISDAPALGGRSHPNARNSLLARDRFEAALDDQNKRQWEAGFSRWGGYYLTIAGTDHFNFSDAAFTSSGLRSAGLGPLDRYRASRIISDYLLQLFSKALRGGPAPLLKPGAQHDPAVKLRIWLSDSTIGHPSDPAQPGRVPKRE